MFSQKSLAVLVGVTVLLSSCGTPVVTEAPIGKPVRTVVVQKAPFSDEVRVTGRISAQKETAVASQVSGVIRTVLVEVGKKVKAGQPLAVIDLSNSTISASYNSASDAYLNALASYGATKEALASDLQSAKIALENAQIARDNLYKSTQPTLDTYRGQLNDLLGKGDGMVLDSSKNALESFKKNSQATMDSLNTRLRNTYTTLRASLQASKATFDKALHQADVVLGVTDENRNANADYANLLAAKDASKLAVAKTVFYTAQNAVKNWSFDGTSDATLETSLDTLIPASNAMADLYVKLYSVMQSTIPGGSFSQTSLDGLTATITGLQGSAGLGTSTVLGAQSVLSTTRSGLDDLKNTIQQTQISNQTTLLTLTNNVGLTQSQIESALAGIQAQRDAADNGLKAAQSAYESAQARNKSSLSSSKQVLDGSKGQRDVASVQLANARITAPFDGVVLSRSVEVGNLVAPGTPLFVVGDSTSYRVKADVTTETAASLLVGQPFNATQGLNTTPAVVAAVAPGADPVSRMVRVEFALAKPASFLKWGDYVDLYGSTSQTRDLVISVPFSALIAVGQGDFQVMMIASGSFARATEVKLGQQNSSRVEVVSGLRAGDEVVTQGALSLRDGELVRRIVDEVVSTEAVLVNGSGGESGTTTPREYPAAP